jgi:hypothetical protein
LYTGPLANTGIDLLSEELNTLKISENSPTKCSYLHLLPSEIRIQIFKLLLVDPDLAECVDTMTGSIRAGVPGRLHPAILRTCRKFYEEASEVLYNSNVMPISCVPESGPFSSPCPFWSPLIKSKIDWDELDDNSFDRPEQTPYGVEHMLLEKIPGFPRIRHWKIFVAPYTTIDAPQGDWISRELLVFCRAACQNTPKSIFIQPICEFEEELDDGHEWIPLHELLSPLRLFRGVGLLKLSTSNRCFNLASGGALPREIHSLVEGNSPIYRVFMMYSRLLAYAQLFERCEEFKADMGRAMDSCRGYFLNPYQAQLRHTVEEALDMAKDAANGNDWSAFSLYRSSVVNYLEQQYNRISFAYGRVAHWEDADPLLAKVRRMVIPLRLRRETLTDLTKYERLRRLYALRSYAASFSRDITPMRAIRLQATEKYFRIYSNMDREVTLERLSFLIEEGPLEQAEELYVKALKDMDDQFDSIKQARRELFDYDPPGNDPGCTLHHP